MLANKHCRNELYIGFDIVEDDNIVSIVPFIQTRSAFGAFTALLILNKGEWPPRGYSVIDLLAD